MAELPVEHGLLPLRLPLDRYYWYTTICGDDVAYYDAASIESVVPGFGARQPDEATQELQLAAFGITSESLIYRYVS